MPDLNYGLVFIGVLLVACAVYLIRQFVQWRRQFHIEDLEPLPGDWKMHVRLAPPEVRLVPPEEAEKAAKIEQFLRRMNDELHVRRP